MSLGTINDLKSAIAMAHDAGALVFVDAVHYAPHALIDVKELDCDFVGMSAYKFYGPHIGVLYAKRELYEQIDFPRLVPAPITRPRTQRQERRTRKEWSAQRRRSSIWRHSAAGMSLRESLRSMFQETHARNRALFTRLWNALSAMPRVKVYGPPPNSARTPTLAFTIDGCTSTDAARRLAEKGLFLSHGDFYAYTIVERLGLQPEGLIRAGCAIYTTEEEIDRLIDGVHEISQ